ncbi:MAG: ABC transporter permease [Coriobacteriales bacterium]|nr:ABC transporter permease [Coriobacteriales bacterium]
MVGYIGRRLLQFIPVLLGVTLVLFFITTILPGDPLTLRTGQRGMSAVVRLQLEREYGLDKPWYEQYANYLGDLARGDLGTSIRTGKPVAGILAQTLPYTLRLALAALLVEIFVGIGAGIVGAVRHRSFWDVLVTLSSSLMAAVPIFWLGLLLQYFFGIWLKEWTGGRFYLPVSGASGPQFPDIAYIILPAITMAAVSTALAARITRNQLLEVANEDYIRTARAKGLSPNRVLWNHSMRNSLVPIVTFLGIDLSAMLSGAVLTETVFNWPGIGFTVYQAIQGRDYPVIFGAVIVVLALVMAVNLAVDVSYAFIDPRMRMGSDSEGLR